MLSEPLGHRQNSSTSSNLGSVKNAVIGTPVPAQGAGYGVAVKNSYVST